MANTFIWETYVGNAKAALALRSRCVPALHVVGCAGEGHCLGGHVLVGQ